MALAVAFLVASLMGAETHYVLVFAHQDTPAGVRPDPRKSHSFACWVRVADDKVVETFTISWTGIHGVRFLKGAQPGRNLSLERTFERARDRDLCVTMWGPFVVCPTAFDRARCQFERLQWGERTGGVEYNVLDGISRSSETKPAINCIHVLTDLTGKRLRTCGKYGIKASEFIVEKFYEHGVTLGRDPRADWIWDAVRPACAQVTWRTACTIPVLATNSELADPSVGALREDATMSSKAAGGTP